MDALRTIRDAHAWMRWLTTRTLDAAARLPEDELRRRFEIGMGSVYGTLLHLYGAERIWIAVLDGSSPVLTMPTADDIPTLAQLRSEWPQVRSRWDTYLGALTVAECDRIVIRTRDGKEHRQRAGDALMQVPTHALYHNAQISFMFRSLGRQLPDSSWILWGREHLAAGHA